MPAQTSPRGALSISGSISGASSDCWASGVFCFRSSLLGVCRTRCQDASVVLRIFVAELEDTGTQINIDERLAVIRLGAVLKKTFIVSFPACGARGSLFSAATVPRVRAAIVRWTGGDPYS